MILRTLSAFAARCRRRWRQKDREILFRRIRRRQPTLDHGDLAIMQHVATHRAWRYPDEWRKEEIEMWPWSGRVKIAGGGKLEVEQ
jgi:hypothetical protein